MNLLSLFLLLATVFVTSQGSDFSCLSWRFAVEAENIIGWTVPPQCENYIKDYVSGYPSQYSKDLKAVTDGAWNYTQSQELADDGKNIWIFDVDDTTLSYLPYYEVHHYGAEAVNSTALNEWFMEGKLPALNETLEFYNNLLKLEKIKLIILTGRRDYMEDDVKANLQEAGYGNWTKLILKETSYSGSAFEFKDEERRKLVEEDGSG